MVVLTEFGSIHLLDFVGPQFIEEKGLVYMEEGAVTVSLSLLQEQY